MKGLISSLFAAALLLTSAAHAATWKIDESHAFAVFKVMHLGIAPSYGQFMKINGDIDFDPASPEAAKISVEIDADSIFTANKKRDDHLKGPDFFDTKQFPKVTFKSTAWKKTGDKTFAVSGDLTIKGQTKPITANVVMTGAGKDPWGNDRAGFTAEFTINRLDFGVSYMPEGLGKDVTIMLSLEGIQQK